MTMRRKTNPQIFISKSLIYQKTWPFEYSAFQTQYTYILLTNHTHQSLNIKDEEDVYLPSSPLKLVESVYVHITWAFQYPLAQENIQKTLKIKTKR